MIQQGLTHAFLRDVLLGIHDFGSDDIRMALYVAGANITPELTNYTIQDEVVGVNYTAGGAQLVVSVQTSDLGAWLDITDVSWPGSISAAGAMIYNASKSGASIAILSFGSEKTSTTSFDVRMPQASIHNALIRFPIGV